MKNLAYLNLTEEQQLMIKSLREFVENEVKPAAPEIDKSEEFPMQLWKRMSELGLIGIDAPEEYGGLAQGVLMEQIFMEELAKECPVLALVFDAHLLSFRQILKCGTDEQKKKYLSKLATGEMISASAYNDPAGSTSYLEWAPIGVRDGDDVIINTTKVFITNSHVADVYVVQGFIDGPAMYSIIVDKGTPGLITGQIENKMGMNGSYSGTVRFVDVRVPKENILQLVPSTKYDSTMFLNISAISLGLAEGVLERTTNYVKGRIRNGRPLAGHQVVAHHIAKMRAKVELSRSLLYRAAMQYDKGIADLVLTYACKAYVCEMGVDVARQCIQLHGGVGYAEDTGIARFLRDALCNTIGELPTDLHYDYLALTLGLPIDTSFPQFSND